MAYGFSLLNNIPGAPVNAKIGRYAVSSGDGTAIFIGDPVKTDGTTGAIQVTPSELLPAVIVAAAGNTIRGVCVGVDPIVGVAIGSESLNRVYRPASTQMVIEVCDDPYALFAIASESTIAITKIGENSDFVAHAGSTATGVSGFTLNATSGTATAGCRIMGLVNSPNNIAAASTASMVVMINEHELKEVTGE